MKKSWITATVGVLVVLGVASFTVLGTKVSEKKITGQPQEVYEKIESNKGVVTLENFVEKPESIKFIDPSLIEIRGLHKKFGYGMFQVNLDEMKVHQTQALAVADAEKYSVEFSTDLGQILTASSGEAGLFHLTGDGTLRKISGNFMPSKSLDVKLSANGEKLIYLVKESGQMATYSLVTGKKKVVPGKLPDVVVNHFHDSVFLSPEGGYFTVFDGFGPYESHSINVYGADSGRKYAEEIQGTSPKWSGDDSRLAFVYSGQISGDVLTDTRVGYIKFPEKEIVYFDKVPASKQVSDNLFWSLDGMTLLYMLEERETKLKEMRTYGVSDGSLFSFDFAAESVGFPDKVSMNNSQLVLYWKSDSAMKILSRSGQVLSDHERIDTISNFTDTASPYLLTANDILRYGGNQLVVVGETGREALKIEGLQTVSFSEDSDWIVAGIEEDGKHQLNILARK